MAQVNRYRVVLYGATPDKPDLKAKIELYASSGGQTASSMGKIRFHEGELPRDDKGKGSGPEMNLPSSMLPTVIQLLQQESPVYFAFHEGRAVLGTAVEPVGGHDENTPQAVKVVEMPGGE